MHNTREMELWQLVTKAFQNSIEKFGDIFAKDVTRDLLDNGVAVQKWIPFAEKLPEQSGYYLILTSNGNHIVAPYSARHKAFNAFDTDHDARFEIACTHWMPLPEPPEGE